MGDQLKKAAKIVGFLSAAAVVGYVDHLSEQAKKENEQRRRDEEVRQSIKRLKRDRRL